MRAPGKCMTSMGSRTEARVTATVKSKRSRGNRHLRRSLPPLTQNSSGVEPSPSFIVLDYLFFALEKHIFEIRKLKELKENSWYLEQSRCSLKQRLCNNNNNKNNSTLFIQFLYSLIDLFNYRFSLISEISTFYSTNSLRTVKDERRVSTREHRRGFLSVCIKTWYETT